MRLAFFSSSPLVVSLLETLKQQFKISLVVTNPDRPVGRKAILTPSPLKTWAQENQVEFLTPKSLKTEEGNELENKIKEKNIDLGIVIDYGLLIPRKIFAAPKEQTINIHFSLLPKYRGPYPDAFVILQGEKKTGISFVLIDEGFDTGDLLAQSEVVIEKEETAQELHARLYQLTEEILPYIINHWVNWSLRKFSEQNKDNELKYKLFLPPQKQDHSQANYTKRLERDDGYVSWETLQKILRNEDLKFSDMPKLVQDHLSKEEIFNFKFLILNFYRALSPWPGVWTKIKINNEERRLKILKAKLKNKQLVIEMVQIEGKKPMPWQQFLRAYPLSLTEQ